VLVVLLLEGLHLAVSGVELESELRVSRLALRQPLRRHARPHARLHLQKYSRLRLIECQQSGSNFRESKNNTLGEKKLSLLIHSFFSGIWRDMKWDSKTWTHFLGNFCTIIFSAIFCIKILWWKYLRYKMNPLNFYEYFCARIEFVFWMVKNTLFEPGSVSLATLCLCRSSIVVCSFCK
jgi:hypothetical protein